VLLLTVTIASLLLAATMGVVTWRLSRDARERSAARVAALAAEIDGDAPMRIPSEWRDQTAAAPGREAEAAPFATSSLFGSHIGSPSSRPMLARLAPALLAGVLIVGGIAGLAVFMSSRSAAAAAAGEPRPLQLLSLRHDVKDGTLTIAGLVRNPERNPELPRITAVVFLFDAGGSFLASGRAPLDFGSLSPGEESPFLVTVNAPSGVSRYRVSFRREEGGVIPHVDRREVAQP
jgi:hypothetical protein